VSCGHGCGHWHDPSYDRDWWFRGDWPSDPRMARRDRTWSRVDDELAVDALEVRLAGLHEAIQHLETELAELRSRGESGPPSQRAATAR
jgi:hypothetical protein